MTDDREEYEFKKKAIFDTMSKRGREQVLRIGYENWEPFQEPKDPRERIFSAMSLKANELVREFYQARLSREESTALQKELFDLSKGLLQGERRAQVIMEFCNWLKGKLAP